MTSWLEPLGRDRARRRAGRAPARRPGPERPPGMAGWDKAPGTVPSIGSVGLRAEPTVGQAESGSAGGRTTPAKPVEPAGGLWPAWGPRRAQWSAVAAAGSAAAAARAVGQATPKRPARFSAIFAAMNASIVRLDGPLEPDVSTPAADRLLVGVPEHRVWNYFTDSTQTFFAGRWSGTRGKWRVRYTENELCVMTAGRVVITSDTGERHEFGPGAAFVIPAGFSGTWEVLEDCAKVYAIFEPRT